MIAEASNTAQLLMRQLGGKSAKVPFIPHAALSTALLYLENKGIPGSKHEDYKYCNLDAMLRRDFKNIDAETSGVTDIGSYKLEDTITLVVVNGHYSEKLSDRVVLKGVKVNPFSKAGSMERITTLANAESDAFVALNTAYSGDGLHLQIEKNIQIASPFHIIYVNASAGESSVQPRNLVEVGENSSVTLIEQHVFVGDGKTFSNYLSEKFVGKHARLNSVLLQEDGDKNISVNTTIVSVESGGEYDNTTVTLTGHVVRNNHHVLLDGPHAVAHLNGLFSTTGTQLVDNHTLMDHRVPNCESNELYKGLAADKSTGVFNGKIFVRPQAQKTNAYQSSKNILLSDDATINTKPQLEIFADDVKCSHGTSTGRIDEEALFYLNARGIGKETAKKMLLASFAQEVIDKLPSDNLKIFVEEKFRKRIET
jgi:Fe-S cluster assembly protein SufD